MCEGANDVCVVKILVVGESGVGKSLFIRLICEQLYNNNTNEYESDKTSSNSGCNSNKKYTTSDACYSALQSTSQSPTIGFAVSCVVRPFYTNVSSVQEVPSTMSKTNENNNKNNNSNNNKNNNSSNNVNYHDIDNRTQHNFISSCGKEFMYAHQDKSSKNNTIESINKMQFADELHHIDWADNNVNYSTAASAMYCRRVPECEGELSNFAHTTTRLESVKVNPNMESLQSSFFSHPQQQQEEPLHDQHE